MSINTFSAIQTGNSQTFEGVTVTPCRDTETHFLAVTGSIDFEGDKQEGFIKAPYTAHNAEVLRSLFPWTRPSEVLRRKCSFGCGDRLGYVTRFHAPLFKRFDAFPVFAQQSVRELTLTNRTFQNVIDDATFQVFETSFTNGYGADGDHLKSFDRIKEAVEAGVTMLTLDLSDELKPEFAAKEGAELENAYLSLPTDLRTRLEETYLDKTFSNGISFDRTELARCAVIYSSALDFASEVFSMLPEGVDLEISIDETTAPTLPAHHYFVAGELIFRGVRFESVAPRFIGEFQKGVDYIGDLSEFRRQFALHAAIAEDFGTYKISVHSGSDKFAVFPIVGELTKGRFHVKTAGTSYLEALKAIAVSNPELFRAIYAKSFAALPAALKLYHITADFSVLPKPCDVADSDLVHLLDADNIPGRQILHITYGAMLGEDMTIRSGIYKTLFNHENILNDFIDAHFTKHLTLLGVPLK